MDHARVIAESVKGKVGKVEIVQAKTGKDAFDHLAAGHGLEDFVPVTMPTVTSSTETPRAEPGDVIPEACFSAPFASYRQALEHTTEASANFHFAVFASVVTSSRSISRSHHMSSRPTWIATTPAPRCSRRAAR